MCLLAVLFQVHPDAPLVIAANRDELFARPAAPMGILREASPQAPRIAGGKDLLAGGTWLAIGEHGVVAGLTNRPTVAGRDASKRSRGELPLAFVGSESALFSISRGFLQRMPGLPDAYNPAWLLVGDRDELFYVELDGTPEMKVRALDPGVHVLENRPLDADSPKADRVRDALAGHASWRGDALRERLQAILRDHEIPARLAADELAPPPDAFRRPRETEAICVHAGPYGTRSSAIVIVPPAPSMPPFVEFAHGPPCVTAFRTFAFP